MAAVPFSRPGVSLGLGHGSGGPLACTGGLASCWPLTQVVRAGLVSLVLSAFLRLETYLQHQVMRKVTCCLKLMETGDSVTETGWRKVGHCCHSPGSGDPMGAGCSWFWRPHGGGTLRVLETLQGGVLPGALRPLTLRLCTRSEL